MNTKTTIAAIAIVSALALVIAPSLMTTASAAPKGTTDTSCTTPNGNNEPGGQQPSCTGGGLDQQTCVSTTGNGKCPKGQN
jgi:hypothetical protein